MGVAGAVQGEGAVDHRPEQARGDPGPDPGLDRGRQPRLLVGGPGPQGRAGDHGALLHQPEDGQGHLAAAKGGDEDDASAGPKGVQLTSEIVPAHHVEDHVGAALVLDPGAEVLGGGVDGDVGAQFQGPGRLGRAPGRGDDPGPGGPGHLDGGDADPRGGAVDEQGLARLQGSVLEDVGPDREDGLGKAGGLGQGQSVGDGKRVPGVDDGVLGVAAAAQQGADPVAGPPASCAPDHLPGDLQAQGVRRAGGRGIAAHALQEVGPVDPGRRDADQDLALAGFRAGKAGRLQGLGAAASALHGDGRHHRLVHATFPPACAPAARGAR